MYEITLAQKNRDYDLVDEIKVVIPGGDALAFITHVMDTLVRQGVSVTIAEVRKED